MAVCFLSISVLCIIFAGNYNKKTYRQMNAQWCMTMLFLLTLACGACSNKAGKGEEPPVADSLPPDETMHQGVVQLQSSHVTDTVTWNGKTYRYDIVRQSDASLPKVKDNVSGNVFSDNHIDLKISCDGKEVFSKRFLKTTFNSYLDADFKQNGILEGLVFDTTTPGGLRFATSVCYPRSDLFIPLVIIIDAQGNMSVRKDEIMDTGNLEEGE